MFAYTDGVTEASFPAGEFFGPDRLLRELRGAGSPLTSIVPALAEQLAEHHAGEPPSDDVTMLCLARA